MMYVNHTLRVRHVFFADCRPARSKALSSEAEINENEQDAASISLISNFDRCFAQKNILSNICQFVCILTHL